MIKLRHNLKRIPDGGSFSCIVRRDQRDTVEIPFSRTGYHVSVGQSGNNRYIVTLKKDPAREGRDGS